MKKIFLLSSLLVFATAIQAQKYFTRTGKISFYASTPLENVEAISKEAGSVINTATKELAFQVPLKSFLFAKTMMQEHFNENYVESDKYPTSTFKGKISDDSKVDFTKDGSYPVTVSGELTLHGVTKKITTPATITIKDGAINAVSKFKVKAEDFNIRIPSLVSEKIAKEIEVKVDCNYQPMK